MKSMKRLLSVLAVVLLLVAAALVWLLTNFHVVGFRLYPKGVQDLDLRSREISVSEYETLTEKMPGTRIRWNVPFQGQLLADDTAEVTVTSLSREDVAALSHLENLKTVHALECSDYDNLLQLRNLLPETEIAYYVPIGGIRYHQDAAAVKVSAITAQEIQLLQYLPRLEMVILCGSEEAQDFSGLIEYCEAKDLLCLVRMGDRDIPWDIRTVEISGITRKDLTLLPSLAHLQKLELHNPKADPELIFALEDRYPKVQISWDVEIGGEIFRPDVKDLDLTALVVEDVVLLEQRCAYLPELESVTLGLCGIDEPKWGASKTKNLSINPVENEDLAAFRERVREDYKVVWTVRLGPSIALRTDADNFMPNHFGVGQLPDNYAYNLRYCEDMVCLDVGHMTLTDISFVEFMPKLKYLILAWTEVQYIEPIRTCKNLVWLELDNSCIRDYSPLVDCTALEDLNIGNTFCDITPVLEMKWLKNLYMILGNKGNAWLASQALPDTYVCASGDATVGGGWRRLPNYYDMRDMLHMYYMN